MATQTTGEVVDYVFCWHALSDACPKCQRLNGREWRDQNVFQHALWDPIWGDIWNFDEDHTLAHPNCRCQLEVRVVFNVEKLVEEVRLESFLEESGRLL